MARVVNGNGFPTLLECIDAMLERKREIAVPCCVYCGKADCVRPVYSPAWRPTTKSIKRGL